MKPYLQFLSPLFFKYYIIILFILICIIIHYRVFKKPADIENFQNASLKNKENKESKNSKEKQLNNLKDKYLKEKQLSENRRKEIDSQNDEIKELEKESKNFEKNYNEEKELNNILVNSSNDEQLLENLVGLLRRRQISGAKISELDNLNRLIRERLEKSNNYTPDDNLFFQPTDLGNGLLNELQNEYNELIEKEKQESDKIVDSMNKEFLEKENRKLLKYNKAMNDHYKYLKDEKNKLNLVNLSGMVEDNLYSFMDDINKSKRTNSTELNNNSRHIEGFANQSITIKERMDKIKDNVNNVNNVKNNRKANEKFIDSTNNSDEENNSSSIEEENNILEFDDDNIEDNGDDNIYTSGKSKENEDLIVGFINHVFEILNKYLNSDSKDKSKSKINLSFISTIFNETKNILMIMFKEENFLASGLIFIVLSMCLFFIDISS